MEADVATKASGSLARKKKTVPKRSGVMSRVGFLLGKKGRKRAKRKARKKPAKSRKTKPRKTTKPVVLPQSISVDKPVLDDGPSVPSPRYKRDRAPSPPRERQAQPVQKTQRPVAGADGAGCGDLADGAPGGP